MLRTLTTTAIAGLTIRILALAQSPASSSASAVTTLNPAIEEVAAKLKEPLHKAKAKHLLVLDFLGPSGEKHPVGAWLADQLSAAIRQQFPDVDEVDRNTFKADLSESSASLPYGKPAQAVVMAVRGSGANSFISGTFLRSGQDLTIMVAVYKAESSPPSLSPVSATLRLTPEIEAISSTPIPMFEPKFAHPGKQGITWPMCAYCPAPRYNDEAKRARLQGVVVLWVAVRKEGTADKLVVVRGLGLGLEENAIEAVKGWRFKPARDPDGRPVDAVVPIEVMFRLY
jgi:TonB family protein